MTNRERVLAAFNNQPVDRVPVGFWFHFLPEEDMGNGLDNPKLYQANIDSHKKYIEAANPDFVKIMSDGYFVYPRITQIAANSASDLRRFTPLSKDHPWIQQQINLAKTVAGFLHDTSSFYNIFSPSNLLRIGISNEKFLRFFKDDPGAVAFASECIAQDLADLSQLLIEEAGVDGIYLSVQNPENALTPEEYETYISPSDKTVLTRANIAGGSNILHCCGYANNKNDLNVWKDYEAKAVNWATAIEHLSLADGKRLFGGKAVIGGFDNRAGSLLHKGSKENIESFTENLLKESGQTGILIGADCTVPSDIALERFAWVREKAASLA